MPTELVNKGPARPARYAAGMQTKEHVSQGSDKSHRAAASQYFVAAELCRQELVAVITLGNCPNTDILVSDKGGTRFVHVQVKTFVPGNKTCSVGQKAEKEYGENFFWVLAGIPLVQGSPNEYYIIPAADMSREIRKQHEVWLTTPGKKGQKHNATSVRTLALPPRKGWGGWNIAEYRDRWDLIEARLRPAPS